MKRRAWTRRLHRRTRLSPHEGADTDRLLDQAPDGISDNMDAGWSIWRNHGPRTPYLRDLGAWE
ncbi:hypothetical protein M413DRAFT_450003 [Hebeloma cylindrosporum]|uniref:Uncharacterized protein n=1 Tax=Hebeloma cylindrosporum TaxID=76867 RepID=A0A0C2Y1D3_HEBCY|nr:hypothetical protein M413DRAFT_450003 [Hebeloma cylindrosporum h7]